MKIYILCLLTLVMIGSCNENKKTKENAKSISYTEKQTYKIDNEQINNYESGCDTVFSQSKTLKNLSSFFTFKIYYVDSTCLKEYNHYWTIDVYKKDNAKIQSIKENVYVLNPYCLQIDSVSSLTKDIKIGQFGNDNYYGDFIVADLNADNLEDFAIKNDIGGNGGTFYSFFIQKKNGQFERDNFLSDSIRYFPNKIYKNTPKIQVSYFSGVCGLVVSEYQFEKINQWKELSSEYVDVCEKK